MTPKKRLHPLPPPLPPPDMRKRRHKCTATAERISRGSDRMRGHLEHAWSDTWQCQLLQTQSCLTSLSLPSFPRQHRVHRISHTSSCVITGTPQAGSDLSGRFSHVFERNCCKPWNEPVKSTFKKMCKLRFPFRSTTRILQKGRQKIQAWKKGLKAVGVSDDVMIRF